MATKRNKRTRTRGTLMFSTSDTNGINKLRSERTRRSIIATAFDNVLYDDELLDTKAVESYQAILDLILHETMDADIRTKSRHYIVQLSLRKPITRTELDNFIHDSLLIADLTPMTQEEERLYEQDEWQEELKLEFQSN
jgi:hypothetical protein